MPKLTAEAVGAIYSDCVPGEDFEGDVQTVAGIKNEFRFDPAKIAAHKAEIKALLDELPPEFKDGMTFLNACVDKNGEQWGEHVHVECLFALGMAAKLARFTMERKIWEMLPGGMPYITVGAV